MTYKKGAKQRPFLLLLSASQQTKKGVTMKKIAFAFIASLALAACGGGGSGSSSTTGNKAPIGIYTGTTEDATKNVAAVFMPGNVLYVIYADNDGLAGGMAGKLKMISDEAFTVDAVDYYVDEDDFFTASIEGTYRDKQDINVTVTEQGESGTLSLLYEEQGWVSLSELAGIYVGDDGQINGKITIDKTGKISTLADDGCITSGKLEAVTQINAAFKVSLTYGSTCGDYNGAKVQGVILYNQDDLEFYGIAHNENMTAGGVLWGSKL